MTAVDKPDPAAVLATLKDFQRRTAETVFRRLFLDADRADRFLVADEVGLGKTMVAKAVIAQAVAELWDRTSRIDVVYVCSNADIARQNLDRLKRGIADGAFAEASRLTLLPLYAGGLSERKLNFVSLTPSTSLDLRGSHGAWRERALLFIILAEAWGIRHAGAKNMLQGTVQNKEWWRRELKKFRSRYEDLDETLIQEIVEGFRANHALRVCYERLAEQCRNGVREVDRREVRTLVGDLRRLLAKECLHRLEPDLIILDEFQRFKHLLDSEDEDEVTSLARTLFEYKKAGIGEERVRLLLLSATPYKMYTQSGESSDDHHADFLRTIRFLLQNDAELASFKTALAAFREALTDGAPALDRLREARKQIEATLRKVMCRTERLGIGADRNGMIKEVVSTHIGLQPADLDGFVALDRVARQADVGDTVEIWKSAPLPLGLMDHHYSLKRKVLERIADDDALKAPLRESKHALVPTEAISRYEALDIGHARTRDILAQCLDNEAWRLLWVPPTISYWNPGRAYAHPALRSFTKRLVFSSWKVAPKAIAGVLSYEAEQRMVTAQPRTLAYPDLYSSVRPLLRFAEADGRLTGMAVFTLLYPSPTWACEIDPLQIALAAEQQLSADEMVAAVESKIQVLLQSHVRQAPTEGPIDQAWYWAAPLLLDRDAFPVVREWLEKDVDDIDDKWDWSSLAGDAESDSGHQTHFSQHVEELHKFVRAPRRLGRPPADLFRTLAKIAVASPAVVSLRALLRVAASRTPSVEHLGGAAAIGLGFRTLFNLPETQLLLRAEEGVDRYWERALDECVDGNLQAVLDEYVHVVSEMSGGIGKSAKDAYRIAEEIAGAVSLRTAKIEYDDLSAVLKNGSAKVPTESIRCRFALRLADGKTHDDGDLRQAAVRSAFNSPFRPFVLASTSVGQEGLDFHPYCHAIVHWNLPSNPVDFEQREGRIHRYKGHFLRRNLAARYHLGGLAPIEESESNDPWARLYFRAVADRAADRSDLEPYWLFEGEHKIERHLPMLPLSRDWERYGEMKAALALYRLVFGQPRQDDLLRLLEARWNALDVQDLLSERIDLQPTA